MSAATPAAWAAGAKPLSPSTRKKLPATRSSRGWAAALTLPLRRLPTYPISRYRPCERHSDASAAAMARAMEPAWCSVRPLARRMRIAKASTSAMLITVLGAAVTTLGLLDHAGRFAQHL